MYKILAIILSTLGTALAVAAETQKAITWQDLLPETKTADTASLALTPKQRYQLSIVSSLQSLKASDHRNGGRNRAVKQRIKEAEAHRDELRAMGLDVEALLQKFSEVQNVSRAQRTSPKASIKGQEISLEGYLLPLNTKGADISEFFLVPFIGTCIHVPPPPPNQIVHVKLARAIKPSTAYATVSVSGVIQAQLGKKILTHVDGSAYINYSYNIKNAKTVLRRESAFKKRGHKAFKKRGEKTLVPFTQRR